MVASMLSERFDGVVDGGAELAPIRGGKQRGVVALAEAEAAQPVVDQLPGRLGCGGARRHPVSLTFGQYRVICRDLSIVCGTPKRK
jgi:hypothetical protein